ncbi:8-oxo-dGTP diphosphatase MutT [Paenibacillus sp. PK3_47]|uniref:(deoxy)nucleoside triphosphate pyrophosphohydrolase n=1 Tax=Paenibacillus sp. PK3_47 TaxID=2072642 RepID=UPI00201D50A8|nr:(deoxy)nucleoside triphosphate pyrophosphohydrolase [Paenibacillus sp. PK3_47]UQZ34966.1 8-oxo-dGTP diphosphatase MutT [Paenibacillus sp. PK3_47]
MIEVAAAIIHNKEGRILIAKRRQGKSQAGLWEFPGGKLEAGEDVQSCLCRELMEEMAIGIQPVEDYGVHEHDYGDVQIRLRAWRSEYVHGEIRLTDHDAYRWVLPGELAEFTFAAADIPFVEKLLGESRDE